MNAEPTREASILIVDDTVENLQLLSGMLDGQGFEVRPVRNGRLALQAIETDPPDLILLDVNMPVMNGYEVCERLKAQASTRNIPVIFISALSETMDKVKAFAVGGSDYVTKPFQLEEVTARVRCHLALRRSRLELERSYAQLHELEQLRDTLVHMIVHDMRSPLSVLLLHACTVRDDMAGRVSRGTLEDFDAMVSAAEQLRGMADTLLDVSRLEAGRMPLQLSECDLCAIVGAVSQRLKVLDTARPMFVDALGPVRVACDERLVVRVVENLISNGVKHTPPGRPLRVSVSEQATTAKVTVRDEGEGIAREFQARIFEKFGSMATAPHARFHSAGLGLALCKLVVEAHGGQVGVESEPGRGSTFWFTLPRTGMAHSPIAGPPLG